MTVRFSMAALALVVALFPSVLFAQQSTVGTPFGSAGHSFQENIGIGWGMRGNGWFFNVPGPAPGAFGGPGGGGASFGGGFGGGGFRLTAEQGSSTSMSSQSPSVTVMNGGMGYFSDTTIRPFVTGLIPVVGNMPSAPQIPLRADVPVNPLFERLARLQAEGGVAAPAAKPVEPAAAKAEAPIVLGGGAAAAGASSAERGDLSVAEIKARRAAAAPDHQAEVDAYLAKAQASLDDGKPGVARIYFQMAARRATGAQQAEIQTRLRNLDERP